jgi:endonuclease/exonuclease/phosphatase family metal-dependent hydrolase
MKKMWALLLIVILLPLLYVGGFILFGVLTKHRPAAVEQVAVVSPSTSSTNTALISDSTFTLMTWNIGYGGLGAETDFFYDDGQMVITPHDWVQRYVAGITETIKQNSDADFILIQEADRKGKRSWGIDEVAAISARLPAHHYAFTPNYDVKYLPFPWTTPLGRIYGGLLSLTRYSPTASTRIALPGITDFPRKIFYLERCLLMQRFALASGKELIMMNTHFEAYDNGGVKRAEMALAKQYMDAEFAKGNYVVIGGDWNIAPPNFDTHQWEKEKLTDSLYMMNNDPNFMPGWKYVYDAHTPTNRKNNHAFDPKTTFTTVIDYYMVSPNIDVQEIKGIDAGFQYSDHNPVRMKIKLK